MVQELYVDVGYALEDVGLRLFDKRTSPQHYLHGRPPLPRKLRVKSVTKVKTVNKYNYEHHD